MKKRRLQGFTLIELTLVMGMSVMVAGALIGVLQSHIQMLNQAAKYKFLAQDAPTIGLLLTKTMGNAEDYRVYSSGAAARSNSAPTLSGPAVGLWMRQPNSLFRRAVLAFETLNNQPAINFYLAAADGTFSGTPSWKLAGGELTSATFDATSGILTATLNGSFNDQYQFAAEKK